VFSIHEQVRQSRVSRSNLRLPWPDSGNHAISLKSNFAKGEGAV
jgi:hypothetical protein